MPEYIRIDSDSASSTWGSLTGLEKKLILLSVILGILLMVFMILLGLSGKRCDDPPSNSTTVSPPTGSTTAIPSTTHITYPSTKSSYAPTTEPTSTTTVPTDDSSPTTTVSSKPDDTSSTTPKDADEGALSWG